MIYLASPYSHTDAKVMQQRYEAAAAAVAGMLRHGEVVFSPIVHCHDIAVAHDLPRDFGFWERYSLHMLGLAQEMVVLELPGWMDSKGVRAEVSYARRLGIPVDFIKPDLQTDASVVNSNPAQQES